MATIKPTHISTQGLPQPADPANDSITVKSLNLEDSSVSLARDGNNLRFTDASGTKTLSELGGGGGGSTSPGSPVNSLQFNNAGSFGGSANLTFDGTNLALTGTLQVSTGQVQIGVASAGWGVSSDGGTTGMQLAANGAAAYMLNTVGALYVGSTQTLTQYSAGWTVTSNGAVSIAAGGAQMSLSTNSGNALNITSGGALNLSSTAGAVNISSVRVNDAYTLPVADGTSGQVLTTDGAGNVSWGAGGGGGGLLYFVESESTAAPNDTVPVDAFTVANAGANVDVALAAKGTGATLAQIPDGDATGGNKRGTSAVDWQRVRVVATQVASGNNATIAGGASNTASADYATSAGGLSNTASAELTFVGGGNVNSATFSGAVIVGGSGNSNSGYRSFIGGGYTNTVSSFTSVIVGGNQNSLTASQQGNFIGGGWQNSITGVPTEYSTIGGGYSNAVSRERATIAGGYDNTASSSYVFIGGGQTNTASGPWGVVGGGLSNTASGQYATVGGGQTNAASAIHATISGGYSNAASSNSATIGGGYDNTANGAFSTIAGGTLNDAAGENSFVGGGYNNNVTAAGGATSQVICGGSNNAATSQESTIVGGSSNTASGARAFIGSGNANNASALRATIVNGQTCTASAEDAVVVGGNTNVATGAGSFIGGGVSNSASGQHSVVVGGYDNNASGTRDVVVGGYQVSITSTGSLNTIVGGDRNFIYHPVSNGVVCGGQQSGLQGSSHFSFIGNGNLNVISGGYSSVLNGASNTVSGGFSAVLGGSGCTASGSYTFAFGDNATATSNYAVVLGGAYNTARSRAEIALGYYSYDFTDGGAGWVTTDALFKLGNGTDVGASSSNAITVLKNAKTGIGLGQSKPTEMLDVGGNVKFSGTLMPNGDAGTSGYVLTSQGPSSPPVWAAVSGGGPTGLAHAKVALAFAQTTTNTVATVIGGAYFNAAVYDGYQIKLEVVGFVAGAGDTLEAKLYDVTNAATVATVTLTSLGSSGVRSAALVLPAADTVYELQIRNSTGSGAVTLVAANLTID